VERYDVFVIGGGGTGSEVAFRLGKGSGLRVGLAERDKLGGECNHYGCVPTKVMLRSAKIAAQARDAGRFGVGIASVDVDLPAIQQRARDVVAGRSDQGAAPLERVGVTVFLQEARLVGPRRIELADGTRIEADRVVLSTGTEATLPSVEGLRTGPYWTNREAIWEPTEVPSSLAVLGSGAVGIEFAQCYARFGTAVTVLESDPRIVPNEDAAASEELARALSDEGVDIRVGATVTSAVPSNGGWVLTVDGRDDVRADKVLVATGRRPVFDGHDLHAADVEIDDHGRPVLGETLRTTNPGVWAAGDATGDLLFTHVGTYEAALVVDDILQRPRPRDYRVVPRVTYCDPEVASVGLTEEQARAAGHEVRTATLPLAGNERSLIDGRPHGLVKLVADRRVEEVVGGHIVGEDAGAMIHEIVAAMAGRVRPSAVGGAIHAYPTLSESIKEVFQRLADRMKS
jgi:pyruvate/2-oxoglutarate dehydrogenase complex dihydrolipoamide dehydrogenase (E3) component